jgi:hypothetical protein
LSQQKKKTDWFFLHFLGGFTNKSISKNEKLNSGRFKLGLWKVSLLRSDSQAAE